MRAHELVEPYPSVSADDDAIEAARLFAERGLPALLVLDRDGRPYAIVAGSQLLKILVPDFLLRDPSLAGILTDTELQELAEQLAGLTVAQWIPRRALPTVVGPDASALEIAALMASTHTPLVAVVESEGDRTRTLGAITAATLMGRLLAPDGSHGTPAPSPPEPRPPRL
ncbi:CBS domain-containing protein [Streptomyces sp. NPDC050418]|uniref:CBS domain-containing protein n=1 Tax=Streptomyces sp. NPDC050418 TaxID=3365612 RepID=UPI0037990752